MLAPLIALLLTPFIQPPGVQRDGWLDLNKNGSKDLYEDPAQPIDARIDNLLSQMTLEEKTCQLATLYGFKRVLQDELPTEAWKTAIWKDGIANVDEHLNGFVNWGKPALVTDNNRTPAAHARALNEVQRFFIEQTRLGIPVDFSDEGIAGIEFVAATSFPRPIGLGATWDRDLLRSVGQVTGAEAHALAFTNLYAPILDAARDQRWGRFEECLGEDPFLIGELGMQESLGLQSQGVVSTPKHFAVYGGNKGAREGLARTDPHESPSEVENIHLYPFMRVFRDAGALGVMSSYNDYDGEPITGSAKFLTDKLRGEYGFRGYVVSDSDAVEYLQTKHRVAADYKDAVRQAVLAGLNVRCAFTPPEVFINPLRELVREGAIPMSMLDARVRDVLRVKFMLGLLDRPYVDKPDEADKIVMNPDHLATALQASRECLVLLKNEGNTLPLDRSKIKSIAVIGPLADDTWYAATHYGPVDPPRISVLQGLRDKAGAGVAIDYAKGCDAVDARWPESEILPEPLSADEQKSIDDAALLARNSDVAIVVLGDIFRTIGESRSRTSLDLPGRQLDLLKAIHATGKPVVLVLINGRPLSINWAAANIPAILEAWLPGAQGGTAVAEAIFGDINPGGRISCTFPRSVGQLPMNFPYKPGSQDDRQETARVKGALWNFGHGLSYTTFKYDNLRIEPAQADANTPITIACDISNAGSRAGDEVVQLYTRDVVSSVTTYDLNLRGFERISLKPGETKTVMFTIVPQEHLTLINREAQRVVEPGAFKAMIGASSVDMRLEGGFEIFEALPPISAKPQALPSAPQGFVALFDGLSLDGWHGLAADPPVWARMNAVARDASTRIATQRMHQHWRIKDDGVLVFDGQGDNLCTTRDFGDFEMFVDWRIPKGGDSGIYIRGHPQVQIWDKPAIGSGGLYNDEHHPSNPLVVADHPPSEWNTFRIRIVSDRVTVHLNDVLVVDDTPMENYWNRGQALPVRGSIELQAHGGPLEFRNIFIREIGAQP